MVLFFSALWADRIGKKICILSSPLFNMSTFSADKLPMANLGPGNPNGDYVQMKLFLKFIIFL